MTTKIDLSVGIAMFKELFGRDPRPTELINIAASERAVLAVAAFVPQYHYEDLWERHVRDKIEADWDRFAEEFGMSGCLDSKA